MIAWSETTWSPDRRHADLVDAFRVRTHLDWPGGIARQPQRHLRERGGRRGAEEVRGEGDFRA
jgi:hypothetical protein